MLRTAYCVDATRPILLHEKASFQQYRLGVLWLHIVDMDLAKCIKIMLLATHGTKAT